MRNKKRLKAAALLLVFTMTVTVFPSEVFASEVDGNQVQANVVEEITGTEEINTDVYTTKDSVAVADGEQVLVDIPKNGNDTVVMNDFEGSCIEMELPEVAQDTTAELTDNGTVVYDDEENDVSIGVQPLKDDSGDITFEGVRTTITIEDASAPKRYDFEYVLDEGQTMVTSKQYLGEDFDTGEVYIVDADGQIVVAIDPAWAKDANGNDVKTYYEVDGCTLTQVVEFTEDTAFPVVADPTAWEISTCAAAIGVVVVSTAFGAAKILKIKKYIKAAGGVKKAASGVISGVKIAKAEAKLHNSKKWWKYVNKKTLNKMSTKLGNSIGNLCAEILGINEIIESCSF